MTLNVIGESLLQCAYPLSYPARMHSATLRIASLPLLHPLYFIVLSLFVTVAHPYETYDLTDQIAEESSLVQSVIDPLKLKDLNDTLTGNHLELEWPSSSGARASLTTSTALATEAVSPMKATSSQDDPLNAILPRIKFSCKNKSEAYYSDLDFCDIFHYCKSNGYRFTFLCPNDSFYNNQLMACEQNATHLKYCKEKASKLEGTVLAEATSSTSLPLAIISPSSSTEKSTSSKLVSPTELEVPLTDSTVPLLFESTRMSAPEVEKSGTRPVATQTEANKRLTGEDPLSTTTLIPPALFIEPTLASIVTLEESPQVNHFLNLAYPSETLPPSVSNQALESTTSSSTTKLTTLPVIQLERSAHQSNGYFSNKTDSLHLPITNVGTWQSQNIKSGQLTTRRPVAESTSSLYQILNDLDMSTFELSTEKSQLGSGKKKNHYESSHFSLEEAFRKQLKSGQDGAKLSLSIHKFFKEGLPTQYLKSVPKLFRSLSAIRDYEASKHSWNGEQSMPRKNDHSGPGSQAGNGKADHEIESSTSAASMLSIPVLVPVNLSQDDYRRRMSASVLKPIVIPLREKGKLIPAYVLQFSSKWRSRQKRSALNGKRLLSLSIKPSLLYQVIPSLLKIKSIKAPHSSTSVAGKDAVKGPVPINGNYEQLLMSASQNIMPMYALPNGELFPAAGPNPLAHIFKQTGNSYDLSEFNQYMPPLYFVEQHPYLFQPNVNLKKSPIYKRPPLRSKIPGMINNGTHTNQTSGVMTAGTGGLLAVSSTLNGQKVATSATPLMLGAGVLPTHLPTYPTSYTSPTMYDPTSYYSPLLYFGNSFSGSDISDPSRFKPLLKKASFLKKLRAKNAFNPKEEKLQPVEPAPNITMPANIYVPDDILEDFPMESGTVTGTNVTTATATKVEHKQIEHKVSNDLLESFNSDESSPVELFTRSNHSNQSTLFAYRPNRAMSLRGHRGGDNRASANRQRDLSTQAKINANFFNGTAAKSGKSTKSSMSSTASSMSEDKRQEQNANYMDHSGSASSSTYQHMAPSIVSSSEPDWVTGKYDVNTAGRSTFNLTSYLRHLKTHPER